MVTVSSIISTVILDVINVLLIDYMYSSFFERKWNRKLYCVGVILIYLFLDLFVFQRKSKIILDFIIMVIISSNYNMSLKDKIKNLLLTTLLNWISELLVYQSILSIFNCNVLIEGDFGNDSLMIFRMILTKYILYIILYVVLHQNNLIDDSKVKVFKYISLAVSIFYGLSIVLFFDELLFYHQSVGRIFVFTLILYNAVLVLFNRYENMHLRTVHEFDVMKRNRSFQEKYWKEYTESYNYIRKTKHDMINSYTILYELLKKEMYNDVMVKIESKIKNLKDMENIVYLGNPMIDAVLSKKKSDALDLGIEVRYRIGVVRIGNIDIEDLGILLANALDNAIEATVKSSYDFIDVEVFGNGHYLCIKVINYVDDIESVSFDKTSKVFDKKSHGIGIRSMRDCAKKYHGYMDYIKEENKVILIVNLYIK